MSADFKVTRAEYIRVVKKHEKSNEAIHTDKRSVMQSFDKYGTLVASAEYVSIPKQRCEVFYRVDRAFR